MQQLALEFNEKIVEISFEKSSSLGLIVTVEKLERIYLPGGKIGAAGTGGGKIGAAGAGERIGAAGSGAKWESESVNLCFGNRNLVLLNKLGRLVSKVIDFTR